jgi:LmbE family N-acetylglucosaminyl deacetylase
VSPRGSLVAVVAHPDDEALIAGGTLALAADAGTPTGVVSLTRGELGPVAPGSLRDGETLPVARARELDASARELGIAWARCLRHPDGELASVDGVAASRELAEILRPHAPAVLLTFGEDGIYGHPDHVATRAIVAAAARLLAPRPALLEAVWPPELVPDLVAAAAARGLPVDLWGLPPRAFGAPLRMPVAAIDVRPVMTRKLRAVRAHRTQLAPDHLLAALPLELALRHLGREAWHAASAGALAELWALLAPVVGDDDGRRAHG